MEEGKRERHRRRVLLMWELVIPKWRHPQWDEVYKPFDGDTKPGGGGGGHWRASGEPVSHRAILYLIML